MFFLFMTTSSNPLVSQIVSGSALSEESPASVQKEAHKGLKALGVDITFNTRVFGTETLDNGQTEVTLSDGSKLTADLYTPAFGLLPNSAYIPSKFLSSKGFVIVDDYLKAKGAADIWAVGDIADIEWRQFVTMDKQSVYLAKNILSILSNKKPVPYKVTPASSRTCLIYLACSPADMNDRHFGILGRPESGRYFVWKHEDPELHLGVGAQGDVHSERDSNGHWNHVLIELI